MVTQTNWKFIVMVGDIYHYIITIGYLINTKEKVILVTKFLFELVL